VRIPLLSVPTGNGTITHVKNGDSWASTFTSRWITPGLVSYQNVNAGIGYVSKEAIDRSMQTMVGRPLVIKHEPISRATGQKLDPVTPQNMTDVACGYVSRVWWGDDGWAWLEGTCHDEEAKKLARPTERGGQGWKVSCCYDVVGQLGPASKLNGIPYNFEVREFNGEHLALHPNPRYEGARIIMNGQSTSTTMKLFPLFGKPAADAAAVAAKAAADKVVADAAAATAATEATRLANANATETSVDTVIVLDEAGTTATLGEMAASHLAVKNGMEMDPEQEIEFGEGKRKNGSPRRAKMGDILKHYSNAMDAEDDKTEKEMAEKDGKMKMANGSETEAEKAARVKNSGADGKGERSPNVLRLVNAQTAAHDRMILKNAGRLPETQQSQQARGAARWGKPIHSGNKAVTL
jgi:hypothetical protein